MRPRSSLALALLLGVGTTAAAAQTRGRAATDNDGAFIARLGRDTISAETFHRTGNAYEIQQALNGPQAALRHIHLEVTPAGSPSSLDLMVHPIGKMDAPLVARRTLTVRGDSAVIEGKNGDSAIAPLRAAFRPGMLAMIGGFNSQSWLSLELGARQARAANRDTVSLQYLGMGGQPQSWKVVRVGKDSMAFIGAFVTYRAKVDAAGHILGLHAPGAASTFRVSVERVPAADVAALAAAWQAKPMGVASPTDSVVTSVAGANVYVLYSRPSVRGRTVFGGELVPWNSVWRTGANAATVLRTDRDLVIGGTTVPAGAYTLWTYNTPAGSKLIVNKLTKDPRGDPLWGTMYDESQDLARIDLQRTTLASPTEQFTVGVTPQAQGGLLTFAWDRTQLAVPFTVK